MTDIKNKMVKGTFWTLLEKFSLQFVSFGVTMVLSRLLTPSDYGTVALLSVFMSIAGVIVDSGFGSALVQKKNATELEFNSVFYLSIGLSLVAYAILFLCAPAIARFYNTPVLCAILRVTALSLVFGAINSVQGAELTRKMLFHLSFRISLISTIPSAVVGIVCAWRGLGTWALVWQSFTSGAIGVVARWFIIAWRPRLQFSFGAVKGLYSFGWKLSADSFVNMAFDNVYGLVIGKFYQKSDLAYVDKGKAPPALIMGTINGTLSRVAFPALVQYQDDMVKIRSATRRIVQCSSFLIFPALMGFAACAHNLVVLLFGHQWYDAIPYMQCVCFQYALWPLSLVQTVLVAIGRSDVLLKINMVRKVIGFIVMGATLWISPLAFIAGMAFVYTPIATWTNTLPNKKLFNYTFWDEVRDVLPIAAATGVMMAFVWGVDWLARLCGLGADTVGLMIGRIAVQVVLGVSVYATLSIMFRIQALGEYLRIFLPKLERIRPVGRLANKILVRVESKRR